MKEKERKKLSNKCTKLRDKIIDGKFKNDTELLAYIKKKLKQDELEEIAKQFFMREAMQSILEDTLGQQQHPSSNKQSNENEKDHMMYG